MVSLTEQSLDMGIIHSGKINEDPGIVVVSRVFVA